MSDRIDVYTRMTNQIEWDTQAVSIGLGGTDRIGVHGRPRRVESRQRQG